MPVHPWHIAFYSYVFLWGKLHDRDCYSTFKVIITFNFFTLFSYIAINYMIVIVTVLSKL